MSVRSEPDVVIACGCITTPQGRVKEGIDGKDEQLCPKGHGWQLILRTKEGMREATLYERFRFHEYGIPATKRRSKSASRSLSAVPGSKQPAKRPRSEDNVLF